MSIDFSGNKITKINQMDFLNKSVLSCEKENAEVITSLVAELLERIKHHSAAIKSLVLITEGEYDDHISLYCWCTETHGFLVSKSANNSYSTFIVDATDYKDNHFVSQSQLDAESRKHIFSQAK